MTDDGELIELTVGPAVHGGHCLARSEGRVVFVRHAIPGERVRALVTDSSRRGHWRADAVEVLEAADDRVPSVWPEAGPGGVGGGELAHVSPAGQLAWKRAVLQDALQRIGGYDSHDPLLTGLQVRGVPQDSEREGLRYRTRIELVADPQGRAGMYRHRSHEVVALESMPLAVEAIDAPALLARTWRPGARIDAVAPSDGERVVLVDGAPLRGGRRNAKERVEVGGRHWRYRVAASGFWQVHDQAPVELVRAVLAGAQLRPGDHVLDLYSGAGLLTLPLADAVGGDGLVRAVESDERAIKDARRNLHDRPQVQLHQGQVQQVLESWSGDGDARAADVVVLDPPRTGAGEAVVEQVLAARPRRVVYVACDPAALARDVAYAREQSYGVAQLDAIDLFPHTHHVEAVAVLTPEGGS
ncbi:methyltransferase [Ruania suaedae]|uniref:class I SAM-dependent RNA methyltransferase n=1 Tax=Ruania suaedae TaxID=2897774 RepID=UPI001E3E9B40|nr:TRAM domain-containing protein [Ruania suaedae]UFU01606.1 methyltransferase [Ruania suaedae]